MVDVSPDENVLCVRDTAELVRAAAVEIQQLQLSGGAEGEERAVVAPCEYAGVLGVDGEPIHVGIFLVASAVIQERPGRDAGSHDGMP